MSASPATQLKEQGNEAFKSGDFQGAITHYTAAILVDPTDVTFYLNRAAAYLKINNYGEAERDCSAVLALQNTNLKALYRRGQARAGLQKFEEARDDLLAIVSIEPENAAAQLELKNAQTRLDEARERNFPERLKTRISVLSKRLDEFKATPKPQAKKNPNEKSDDEDSWESDEEEDDELKRLQKAHEKKLLKVLQDTCRLVRDADTWNSPDLPLLVEYAQKILDEGIGFAYGSSKLFDYLPSLAHDPNDDSPLITDRKEVDVPIPRSFLRNFESQFLGLGTKPRKLGRLRPGSWTLTTKRHPQSSKMARFRPDLPRLTPTPTDMLAMSVVDARCEVTSTSVNTPFMLSLSQGSSVALLSGMGGWKNRIPAVSYFILDSGIEEYGFAETRYLEPGLVGIPHSMAIDASRKLLLVGDKKRVKSYAWASPSGEFHPDKPLPTHTLDSTDFVGAMTVLPNGTIVRAGDGEAAVWDINSLPTHGPKGKKRIGNRINIQKVWRDDPEAIERSSGSVPTSRIKFVDQPTLSPGTWESLPQAPSTMICSTRCGSTPEYWCLSIDLAHGGKTVARYIGHGGIMGDLSVGDGDPNVFLTGCTDGFARLFDVRRPLPVCTFDVCARREACNSVALGHPDGIPIAFTGTGKTQHVTAWDIRARAAIYELSTGNNEVNALAWDPKRNTLFAATECSYMDTAGFRHRYRPGTKCEMNLGKPSTQNQNRKREEKEEEDGDDDDYERCWPDLAWHFEDYYEYPFDSGNHRVFRYAFKENPDTSILPEYGDVRVGESFWD